jgi:hypothetical protein
MPVNLNLLPPELAVSKSLGTVLKTIRALSVIAVAAFLVSVTGIVIYFVVGTINLNSLNANINQLKSQVTAQEASEQQIILLKDRIAKIEQAKAAPSALSTATKVDSFLANISAGSVINQFDADPAKADITLNLKSNADLTEFIQGVSSSTLFGSIDLSSFGFNPATGYLVGLSMSVK